MSVNKSPVEAEGGGRWSQYSHHVIRRGEKHGRIFASSRRGSAAVSGGVMPSVTPTSPGTNLLLRTNGNQCLAAQTGCWCKLPSYLIQLLVGPGPGQGGEMG